MAITRRRLLASAGAVGVVAWTAPRWVLAQVPVADDVLRAYVDTLVPGPRGAVDAGAVEQLHEQAPYVIPTVVADVTTTALVTHGRPFTDLRYAEREALLVDAFADPARSPYHLIALAVGAGCFYGDFRTRVGGEHLGFPGPSDGYLATYTDRTGHGQPQAEAIPA